VGNTLHSISIGQACNQDSVKKYDLPRILFDKSCLSRILFHNFYIGLAVHLVYNFSCLIILGCIWFVVKVI